jgi:hypothetical protein
VYRLLQDVGQWQSLCQRDDVDTAGRKGNAGIAIQRLRRQKYYARACTFVRLFSLFAKPGTSIFSALIPAAATFAFELATVVGFHRRLRLNDSSITAICGAAGEAAALAATYPLETLKVSTSSTKHVGVVNQ